MQDDLEQTQQQIHEFRNLLGHLNLVIRDLEKQVAETRVSLEHRIERIELALNLPSESAPREPLPARENKERPEILPPQRPLNS